VVTGGHIINRWNQQAFFHRDRILEEELSNMPPPKKLGMRDPVPLGKGKPFDPSHALDGSDGERAINTSELEKLKSPPTSETRLPSATFDRSPGSPFVAGQKHINHLLVNQEVFNEINTRLQTFTPKIVLGDHIVNSWEKLEKLSKQRFLPVKAHCDVLNGIDFIVEDREKLLVAIRNAKVGSRDGFVARSGWKQHWALTLSFLATDGVGYREVFRPRINDRPLDTMTTMRFDTRLGRDVAIDISALHLAVAQFSTLGHVRCNAHIDKLTVTLGGLGDDVQISPSVISHFVNELLFKTKLQGKLPDWILDTFDFSLLNPDEGFLNAGVVAHIINKPNFKWTINLSVGLNNSVQPEWSGNFRFEKSIGTGVIVRF
jgi:hypothetical protein